MFGAVAAEVGKGREVHEFGDLGERQSMVVEEFDEQWDGVAVDVGDDAVAGKAFDG